jgi:two-component system, OmpR family, sensor histidine kinase CpxA
MMPRSLFLKIFLWFWLVGAAIIAALNLVLWATFAMDPNPERNHGPLGEALNLYAESAVQVYDREGATAFSQYVARSMKEAGSGIYLFDASGNSIMPQASREAADVANAVKTTQEHVSQVTPLGRITWGRAVVSPSGKTYIFVTRLRQPYQPRRLTASQIIAAIIVAGIIAYFVALYLTSPVKKLRSTVQAFAQGNLDVRVGPQLGSRRDEVADLGRDFDHMAERISILIESQKRLLGDISHELRSPLARLTVALELVRKNSPPSATGPLNRIEQEAERLNELVGQLLAITRLESGAERVPAETVILEDLVHQVVDDANFEAKPLNKEVRILELEKCRVSGSAELLRSAIENVVRNAVRYTAEGTAVDVSLNWKLDTALLTVHDHGPGVPEADLERIFEPFYRVSEARDRASGGAGLGLSIAERTVKLHRGTIGAANAGDGLLVTIRLPLAPSQPPKDVDQTALSPAPLTSA